MNIIVTALELIVRVFDLINSDPAAMALIAQLETDLGVGTGGTGGTGGATAAAAPFTTQPTAQAGRFPAADPNDPRLQKHA